MPVHSRFLAWLLLPLLALGSCVALADPVEGAAQALHLLDYLGADYPATVADGKVVDTVKYQQQVDNLAALQGLVVALPQRAGRDALEQAVTQLKSSVAGRQDAAQVTRQARQLSARLALAYEVSQAPAITPDPARGAPLYAQHCSVCHGDSGAGDGPAGIGLEPPPSNLRDTARLDRLSLYDLYNATGLGIAGTDMPAFADQLDDRQRWDIATYIASFSAQPVAQPAKTFNLADLARQTPAEIQAAEGPDATATFRAQRAQPPQVQRGPAQLLDYTSVTLDKSLAAYKAGDREQAYDLSVAAYLEGFELVESSLDNVDANVRKDTEKSLMAYRQSLQDSMPLPQVAQKLEAAKGKLKESADLLGSDGLSLSLSYHFEPNHPRDGVTLRVPAPLLLSLPAERLEWLVPGLLESKCIALVRNLPKAVRKNFVPVPDFIKAALQRITFGEGSLPQALGRELLRMTGVRVSDEAWAEAAQQLEGHLKMNLEIVDGGGKFLGEGRDLAELTARFAEASQAALAVPQTAKSQQPVQAKAFAAVAQKTQQNIAGLSMTVYPALVEEGGAVKEGRFSTQAEAEYQHRRALQRLLLQQLAEPAKFLRNKLPGQTELALLHRELGRIDALIEDILLASLDSCVLEGEAELPRDGAGLLSLAERKRADWTEHAERLAKLTLEILKLWHGLQKRFKGKIDLSQAVALNDIKAQLSKLVYPGFVRETPAVWLKELPRYLKAIEMRLEKLPAQVQKDRVWSIELAGLWAQYQARADKHAQEGKRDPELALYRWWMEEYRVSLFAQQLGTKMPVSDKRLSKQWSQVES
ncbi:ATP-dependent helicase HrpA [Pseudomonas syringae pv. solidagae]|uniref:ATP-dependent helicase HrpA n=2 Tax=Pseudomonas syringae group TaxID=136849 RepID=A0A3M5L6V9_PSESX|nr:ATP-dependent helicase HrpA [Pseudomonas syringae pv. solidagae]